MILIERLPSIAALRAIALAGRYEAAAAVAALAVLQTNMPEAALHRLRDSLRRLLFAPSTEACREVDGERLSGIFVCNTARAATAAAASSTGRRGQSRGRRLSRARRSMRIYMSKPSRRSSNTCARKWALRPKLLHDVHSHLTGANAVLFSKKMEPYHLYFVEDLLGPERLDWYHEVRKVCATPQAVGEVFSSPVGVLPADCGASH